jgi:hypothetical protein
LLETFAKVPDILAPVILSAAIMATLIKEAMTPYSMAVAPDSSSEKLLINLDIC